MTLNQIDGEHFSAIAASSNTQTGGAVTTTGGSTGAVTVTLPL